MTEEAALLAHLQQVIEQEAPVWEEAFDAGPGLVVGVTDAATVISRHLLRVITEAQRAGCKGCCTAEYARDRQAVKGAAKSGDLATLRRVALAYLNTAGASLLRRPAKPSEVP